MKIANYRLMFLFVICLAATLSTGCQGETLPEWIDQLARFTALDATPTTIRPTPTEELIFLPPPTPTRTGTPTLTPTPSSTPTPTVTLALPSVFTAVFSDTLPLGTIRDGPERVPIVDSDGKPTGQTAEGHRADISDVQIGWNKLGNLLACVNRFKTERSFSSAIILLSLPATGMRENAFFQWEDHANRVKTEAEDAKGPLPSNTWMIKHDPAGGTVCFVFPMSISDQTKRMLVYSFDRPKDSDLRGYDMAGPFPIPEKLR
ncbi:MAG: hypothetical protein HY327_13430 [Chloroflexi bacterium]|nr:hypothetical protein [Chloroflexota bacterium]